MKFKKNITISILILFLILIGIFYYFSHLELERKTDIRYGDINPEDFLFNKDIIILKKINFYENIYERHYLYEHISLYNLYFNMSYYFNNEDAQKSFELLSHIYPNEKRTWDELDHNVNTRKSDLAAKQQLFCLNAEEKKQNCTNWRYIALYGNIFLEISMGSDSSIKSTNVEEIIAPILDSFEEQLKESLEKDEDK